jgi:hypothetical protein
MGGCPRAEDGLEPNNTLAMATRLSLGQAVEGRVVQGNPDVFIVAAGPGKTLRFTMDSIGEEEEACAAFLLTAPNGAVLYDDDLSGCNRGGLGGPIAVPGATLNERPGIGYELVAPADLAGDYALTLTELGHADNIFTYSWRYRMTAQQE